MFIPPDKISGILEEVVEIMSCCSISARKLACVTGRIISNFWIMGDVCKLMTKSLHRLIECQRGWDALLVLDADVLLEFKFWGEHLWSFVVDFLFVQNGRDVFVHGAYKETCFGSPSFSTPVLFLKLDGTTASQVYWD